MPSMCSRCQQAGPENEETLFCTRCGGRMGVLVRPVPVANPEVPATSPSVGSAEERILRHLGSGSMGDVYEIERRGGERVAVKYLAPGLAADPDALEAFREEARIARMLNHSRCVRVLAYEESPPRIVMELMAGPTLKEIVTRQGSLPPASAVRYALDLIEGLMAVHQFGVIHRDVKPGNCFLTGDDRVKLGDFGLSSKFERSTNDPPLGTVLFSSPEQLRGESVAFDSDQYSACATLYFLLCGKAPHEATSLTATLARAMSEPAPPLRARGVEVAPALERAILRGLERERSRRWPDLERLRRALEPHATETDGDVESNPGLMKWIGRLFKRS